MLSRGFTGREIQANFYPPLKAKDLFRNDIRTCCFISVIYSIPNIEKYIMDLNFIKQRHDLDIKMASSSNINQSTLKNASS